MAPLRRCASFLTTVSVTAMITAASVDQGAGQSASIVLERCLEIVDSAARLRCFESATNKLPAKPEPNTHDMGQWRLVRTANQGGGADAISIMHTADTSRSDLDLAGLALRCGKTAIEALVIVIEPRPPRAVPQIKIGTGADSFTFAASVVPPFSMFLLPSDAAALITGSWKLRSELAIQIDGDGSPVRGVIALAGLQSALQSLTANCSSR
jgi:hypothetical protein